MKRILGAASALSILAPLAHAGGLDRSGQGLNLIYEPGTVLQLKYNYVDPTVSGSVNPTGTPVDAQLKATGAVDSGDIAEAYSNFQGSFKFAVTDRLDVGFGLGEPYGANISYAPTYFLSQCAAPPACAQAALDQKLSAKLDTIDFVGLARYRLDGGFSVLGGLRLQQGTAKVTVPAAGNYAVESDLSQEVGYILGAAWERPDIAARVSLV